MNNSLDYVIYDQCVVSSGFKAVNKI